jgi:hypothetical protein
MVRIIYLEAFDPNHPTPVRRGFLAINLPSPNPMTPNRTLHPATAAARIAPRLLQLAALAIAAGGQWLWRHRWQIGAALVAAVATTYSAGAWCRQQVETLAAESTRRLPSQPLTALAPITATIAAAWGLVDRGTMARAERRRRDRLADIANAYNLELQELLRPIEFPHSNAAVAMELLQRRYTCSIAWGPFNA